MKKTKLLMVLLSLGLQSCVWPGSFIFPPANPKSVDGRATIVFIPGFYGTALRQPVSRERFFVDPFKLLFGKYALSLFQKEMLTPSGPELEVEGVIGCVGVIPEVYCKDVYYSLIDSIIQDGRTKQVVTFAYDWRDDFEVTLKKLNDLLMAIENTGTTKITVVTHSMGGLLMAYYLGYGNAPIDQATLNWRGANKIQKVVFMGTPFQGSMFAFRNILKGAKFPLNKNILQADAMASFPSSYYLLPTGTPDLMDSKMQNLGVNLFDYNFWQQRKLGLLRDKSVGPAAVSEREKFLTKYLESARKFSDLVQLGHNDAWQPPATLKVLNIIGSGTPTLGGAIALDQENNFLFDEEELAEHKYQKDSIYRDGDGTVPLLSAHVPAALEKATNTIIVKSATHDSLFKGSKQMTELLNFIH